MTLQCRDIYLNLFSFFLVLQNKDEHTQIQIWIAVL